MSETHRGAFGEYGGDEIQGFIDRTFTERILLVGVASKKASFKETLDSLNELSHLVRTAGANPIEKVLTKRDTPHPATYIGKGKVEELAETCTQLDIDTVVFDHDLTPSQQVNLEKALGRTAIDRTTVILDIFAQNTSSQEGKVQVELAQLKYSAARLRRPSHGLSQQAGGIGTRGPGETKLEVDRRSIMARTTQLEKQLAEISKRRDSQAKRRQSSNLKQIALVGYTNAGKSTLLNTLTGAEAVSKNRLFSTLDATTRKLKLKTKPNGASGGSGQICLLTDTVGFIRKLPHTLIEAFASTLSGIAEADLILHVVDAHAPDREAQMKEVKNVLATIGALDIPELQVFNKSDIVKNLPELQNQYINELFISATTGEGIPELLEAISETLAKNTHYTCLLVPFSQGEVIADIHRSTRVLESTTTEEGMLYEVELTPQQSSIFAEYSQAAKLLESNKA